MFLIPVYVLLTIKTIICVFIALATSKVSVFPAAQFKMVKSCSILNVSLPRIYAPTCMSQSVWNKLIVDLSTYFHSAGAGAVFIQTDTITSPPPMAEGMEKSLPWGVNIVCTPPPPSPTTQSPPPSSPAFNEPHPINLPIKYKCNVSLDGCPPNAMTYLQLCTTAPWIIHPDWHVDVGVPLADCPPPLPILHPPSFLRLWSTGGQHLTSWVNLSIFIPFPLGLWLQLKNLMNFVHPVLYE